MAERRPSLVLLDLQLPDLSGLALLEGWKQDPRLSTVPVIVLSNSSAQPDLQAAYAKGAAAFVSKPGSVIELRGFVAAVLGFWLDHNRLPPL